MAQAKDYIDDYIPLSYLRDEGKTELLSILELLRGRKGLLIESQLSGVINQIMFDDTKSMKDVGVLYLREFISTSNITTPNSDVNLESDTRDIPENVVFVVRPYLPTMKSVANQIKAAVKQGLKSQYHICFVPKISTICVHLLEKELDSRLLWDRVIFHEFQLGLVAYDSDILSLELDSVFKQCYVDGDLSSLSIIAMALAKIQTIYGYFTTVRSKGLGAKKVLQKMLRLRIEESESANPTAGANLSFQSSSNGQQTTGYGNSNKNDQFSNIGGDIDTLVIMDREIDLVSPLVTPLTYEGLIDDIIGIENGRIKLDASLLGDEKDTLPSIPAKAVSVAGGAIASTPAPKKYSPGEKVSVPLNSQDGVYKEIRDLSIERLGSYLQEKAIHIRERYATFRDNKDASITEIHDFVKKIPKLTTEFKSLNQHINVAEMIKQRTDSREFREQWQGERGMLEGETYLDAIEDLLMLDSNRTMYPRVLRLLCIQSVTAGGIRSNRYDAIRRAIAQVYGYEQVFTLSNLERAGIIRRKDVILVESASIWQTLRKQLRLIDEKVNMSRPEDISYVCAGYAPLLVRLVQLLGNAQHQSSGIWSSMQDVFKLLPGPLFEFNQIGKPEELNEALVRYGNEAGILQSVSQYGSTSSSMTGTNIHAVPVSNTSNSGITSTISSGIGAATSSLSTASNLLNYTTGIMSMSSSNADGKLSSGVGKLSGGMSFEGDYNFNSMTGNRKKNMLVFVVGGLSFLEIAAFRFLSNDPNYPYRIIMATTKLVNGDSFLNSLKYNPF